MFPLSDTLLLLLDEHFHDLVLWAAFLSQQCTFLLKNHTVSTSSNQLSSLPFSSSPNNWLFSWYASNNILKRSLNCFICSFTAIMFLLRNSKSSTVLYFLVNLPLIFLLVSLRVSFMYSKPFSVRFLDLVALPPLPCWNDVFPCALFKSLWAQTVNRQTWCLSDLGLIFTILILIDHHWLTSCNYIWILLVSIWICKICIKSFSKWHSSHKVKQIPQHYILLLCYCTIGIWLNMLYLADHLMNLSITINNR